MIVFLLTIFLTLIAVLMLRISRLAVLSPSLIMVLSFLVSSSVYFINYNIIGKDIEPITGVLIICSIVSFYFGEILSTCIKINNNRRSRLLNHHVTSRMKRLALPLFFVDIFIFLIRYYDLYKYLSETGQFTSLLSVISDIRLDYALGLYTNRGIVIQIVIYITIILELISYIYLYSFVFEYVSKRKIDWRLLLPIAGYLLIILTFTGRSSYIEYIAIATTMFAFNYIKLSSSSFRLNKQREGFIIAKTVKFVAIFSVLFFSYEYIVRNGNSSLLNSITSYIAAPLYGLSTMNNSVFYGIDGRGLTFGYYTLQYLHILLNNFFGFKIPVPSFHNLPFFYYEKGSSNIYTSLIFSYLDYGYFGVIITRFILGFISGLVLSRLIKGYKAGDYLAIPSLIVSGLFIYAALNASIADRYAGLVLDPNTIIKYLVIFPIIIYVFLTMLDKKVRIKL